MTTPRAFLVENQRQSERLRALVGRLSDGDLERSVGHGWTVAATLLHLAFWDFRAAVLIERFERQGVTPSPADVDVLNDAVHLMTRAISTRAVGRLAVEAAERLALQVAIECEKRKEFVWVTARGSRSAKPLVDGWKTVREALELPLPDTAWMTGKPMSRDDFLAWMK